MEIDFSKIKIKELSGDYSVVDLHKLVSEQLYYSTRSLGMKLLAERIYKEPNQTISDEELPPFQDFLKSERLPAVIVSAIQDEIDAKLKKADKKK